MSNASKSDAALDGASVAAPEVKPEPPTALVLYFLRHADAADPAKWTGDDADRPLSSKGRRQAKRLGRLLKKLDTHPDTVLTSPKLRASETARPLARSLGLRAAADDRLSVDFGEKDLAAVVAALEPNVRGLMLVGHDPDFSDLVSWLVGSQIEMQKGALARIDLPDRSVKKGRGSLRWLLPPDAVPG